MLLNKLCQIKTRFSLIINGPNLNFHSHYCLWHNSRQSIATAFPCLWHGGRQKNEKSYINYNTYFLFKPRFYSYKPKYFKENHFKYQPNNWESQPFYSLGQTDINWKNLRYELGVPSIITKDLLSYHINHFWNTTVSKLDKNQYIKLIIRAEYDNSNVSLTKLKNINKSCKKDYIQYAMDIINLKNDAYIVEPVHSIIFSFGIRKGIIKPDFKTKNLKILSQNFNNNKLPIGYKPEDYGTILMQKDNTYTISYSKNIILICEPATTAIPCLPKAGQGGQEKENSVLLGQANCTKFKISYYKNGNKLTEWIDTIESNNTIIRELDNTTYLIKNGNITLIKTLKLNNPIKNISVQTKLNNNFITMDLETVIIDNKHVPYLLSWFDGKISKSYYIKDLMKENLENNITNLIMQAMQDICIRKYKHYHIYLHNFSKFDGTFLIKYLSKIGECQPIIHDNKIITASFNYKDYTVIFNDSYLLLPSSLRNLTQAFKVLQQKGIFPYLLNNIFYTGVVPTFNYFNNITIEEYNKYKSSYLNNIWSFKDEAIKYCTNDCIALYQVLDIFSTNIFNMFSLNINKYPTLPSLSFAIFRSRYLNNSDPEKAIQMISGDIFNYIKQSYTGGAVDMYMPKTIENKKVYAYDVNSLYPFVMKNFKMPVGYPTYFKGDITQFEDKPFGFFKCKITSPEYLEHPILQTHVRTPNGLRTIAPLGTWEGVLFSEEIYNAMKYGYTFEILEGYTFNSEYVFKDFVEDLYNLRIQYSKSEPMNYIAKLLLNSLYGRFGMDDNFINSIILNEENFFKFENLYSNSIVDIQQIEDKYLVQYENEDLIFDSIYDNGSITHNINISIASAITAYARIYMSQFKNNPNYNLYYSDTDSIYIDKELANDLVNSKELGKLKLENIICKGIFLAPKVYALITIDNNTVIKGKGILESTLNTLTINDFETLLNKNESIELSQIKWFKSLVEGNIKIKNQIYTLKSTENKRQLIYKDNKLIKTKPFIINNKNFI